MVRQGGARTPAFYVGMALWAGCCALAVIYGLGQGVFVGASEDAVALTQNLSCSNYCELNTVAFMVSIMLGIYAFGLRDKWAGEGDSAYSVFNPNCRAIPGGNLLKSPRASGPKLLVKPCTPGCCAMSVGDILLPPPIYLPLFASHRLHGTAIRRPDAGRQRLLLFQPSGRRGRKPGRGEWNCGQT